MPEIDSSQLSGLEYQISNLLESCEHLAAENKALRKKLSNSLHERAQLIEKTQVVQARIKNVIAKLKEQCHE